MPTYQITDTQTGKVFKVSGTSPPTEAEAAQIFSDWYKNNGGEPSTKGVTNADFGVSDNQAEQMRREFVKKEGTLGTRIRNTSGKEMVGNVLKEVPRLAQEMVTVPVNTAIKSAYGLAAIPVAATKGADAATEFIKNRPQVEGPLDPSMTGEAIGAGVDTVNRALPDNTAGDIGRAGIEAGLDIAALVGAGKLAKTASAPLPMVKTIVKEPLQSAAKKLTDMTLKQPTTLKTAERQRNVNTLLENNITGSGIPKAVPKLETVISENEAKLGQLIQKGDAAGVKSNFDRTIQNLENLKEDAKYTDDPAANIARIDAEITKLQSHPLLDANGEVSLSELQKMKITQGKQLSNKYITNEGQIDGFQNTIDKARVRGFKEDIESSFDSAFPELAGEVKSTNKKLSDFYAVRKQLGRAASRIENNQGIGIGGPIKAGSGAAIGGMAGGTTGATIGAGIGTLIGVIEHPSVAPRLGMLLYKASKGTMGRAEAFAEAKRRLGTLRDNLKAGAAVEAGNTNQGDNQ